MFGLSTIQLVVIGVVFAAGTVAGGLAARAWDRGVIDDQATRLDHQAERIGSLEVDRDRETARADQNAAAVTSMREQCEATSRALDQRDQRDEQLRRGADEERRRIDANPDDPGALDRVFGVPGPRPDGTPEGPRDSPR